jgi:hypothetical protein
LSCRTAGHIAGNGKGAATGAVAADPGKLIANDELREIRNLMGSDSWEHVKLRKATQEAANRALVERAKLLIPSSSMTIHNHLAGNHRFFMLLLGKRPRTQYFETNPVIKKVAVLSLLEL